jgi:hypothetical protein
MLITMEPDSKEVITVIEAIKMAKYVSKALRLLRRLRLLAKTGMNGNDDTASSQKRYLLTVFAKER